MQAMIYGVVLRTSPTAGTSLAAWGDDMNFSIELKMIPFVITDMNNLLMLLALFRVFEDKNVIKNVYKLLYLLYKRSVCLHMHIYFQINNKFIKIISLIKTDFFIKKSFLFVNEHLSY